MRRGKYGFTVNFENAGGGWLQSQNQKPRGFEDKAETESMTSRGFDDKAETGSGKAEIEAQSWSQWTDN